MRSASLAVQRSSSFANPAMPAGSSEASASVRPCSMALRRMAAPGCAGLVLPQLRRHFLVDRPDDVGFDSAKLDDRKLGHGIDSGCGERSNRLRTGAAEVKRDARGCAHREWTRRVSAMNEHVVEARRLVKRYGAKTVVDGRRPSGVPGRLLRAARAERGRQDHHAAHESSATRPRAAVILTVLGEAMPAGGRAVRARIGVVPQDDNLDPDFTVMENLRVYASYFPRPAREPLEPFLMSLLDFVALADRAGDRIQSLSGGMRRAGS